LFFFIHSHIMLANLNETNIRKYITEEMLN